VRSCSSSPSDLPSARSDPGHGGLDPDTVDGLDRECLADKMGKSVTASHTRALVHVSDLFGRDAAPTSASGHSSIIW
jgi:hypothetical protein